MTPVTFLTQITLLSSGVGRTDTLACCHVTVAMGVGTLTLCTAAALEVKVTVMTAVTLVPRHPWDALALPIFLTGHGHRS